MIGSQRTRWRYWREHVRARADFLEEQLESLYSQLSLNEQESARYLHKGVKELLDRARQAAGIRPLPEAAWNGEQWRSPMSRKVSIEGAYLNLHAADVMLTDLLPEHEIEARIPYLLSRLRGCRDFGDLRLRQAEIELRGSERGRRRRSAYANALRSAYAASDEQYSHLRSFRNLLIIGIVVLSILTVVISTFGWIQPEAILLCFMSGTSRVCPTGSGPGRADIAIIALLGVMGGALSATVALRNMQLTSEPYTIPVALTLLKLPAGALMSVTGLLLVRGQFIPGLSNLDSQAQILAYAVVFGFAQQLITRFVDRRANQIRGRVAGQPSASSREMVLTPDSAEVAEGYEPSPGLQPDDGAIDSRTPGEMP